MLKRYTGSKICLPCYLLPNFIAQFNKLYRGRLSGNIKNGQKILLPMFKSKFDIFGDTNEKFTLSSSLNKTSNKNEIQSVK